MPISSWNASLSIPSLLFMGKPQGTSIRQSFHLSSDGAFSVSDDHGNSYSLAVPVAAVGASSTALLGNSTMAVEETRVMAGPLTLADVKLIFSVYDQFCHAAGVRLVISGTEDWGIARSGLVRIVFDKTLVSHTSYRAYFGNASGVSLGFDWSDSRAFSPAFNATSSTLSYEVGSTFSIDPITVGTSSDSDPTAFGSEGRVFFSNGRYWMFYWDGLSEGYRTSLDGLNWSPETQLSISGPSGSCDTRGQFVSFHVAKNILYYASNGGSTIHYRYGDLNPDGTISWSIPESSFSPQYSVDDCTTLSVVTDTSGNLWVAASSGTQIEVYECTAPNSCSWSQSALFNATPFAVQLIPLTSGRLSLVYANGYQYSHGSSGGNVLGGRTFSGSVWSSVVKASSYSGVLGNCVAISDTTECVVFDNVCCTSYVYYVKMAYDSNSPTWSSLYTIDSSSSSYSYDAGISTDGASNLAISFANGGDVYYVRSVNGGSSWDQRILVHSSGYSYDFGASLQPATGVFESVWTTGSSSPYDVDFMAVPYNIPTAALSKDPWSRPGLSPYESYFSEFSDYVSPGNGLVSVEAGTLDLPGRGLDFAPSLVYSEPYAFRSSGSPYLYDNYTGANLGYGWSLNLPWLGTNYLHLTDGQAFPYSWEGSTFQYNGVTNFVLTANTGGTYTFTMAGGTVYQFSSSKELTSITDRTGNNTITFAYGTNGHISQVTDTIGRTTAFSYDSNGRLSSISEGARTWTLGYTGSQLSSLTDPLNRVTSFQYAGTSGADAWLLSAVLWPTGGKVTYDYGSAPVGTEAYTYYATLRDVYSDPTHLSLSQNMTYAISNGQVSWSNTTISDGTTVREYLDDRFQPATGVMKSYAYNETKTLQQVTEVDSDAAGRTNATKLYSPSGTLLSETVSSYDNWGNLIYTKDVLGQQEWFSYANTNSSGSFGNSGCSTSFYNQNVSSSIHDLLVGSCDYQNGPGSPEQETFYNYSATGNLLQEKVSHSGRWLTTSYSYDKYGNVLSTTNVNGTTTYSRYSSAYGSAYLTKSSVMDGTQNVTTTYTYDFGTGNLLSRTDPNGYTTSYAYDSLDRQTSITYPAVNGVRATAYTYYYDNNNTMRTVDPDGHVTLEYFDGLARQTEAQQWNGSSAFSTVYYTYNWLDKVATKTTATGNTYYYGYDWAGRLVNLTNPDGTHELTSYNLAANTKTVTDEDGHQTVYTYNQGQELVSVKEYNSSSTYYLTTYTYDLSGNTLSVTDAKNNATTYSYNDLNQLVSTFFPDGSHETKTYDSLGNLLTRTTANGSTISYTYDALSRLMKVRYPGSGGTVTYAYDANGNRLSMVSPSTSDYCTYDPMNRLTNQTEMVAGQKIQTLYAYDTAGNVVQITYPDGYALSMGYDGVGYLASVGHFANLTYTADGQISKIHYGNGEVATYTYDNRDRPTQIKDVYGTTVEMELNYTYDGTGNMLTENGQSYGYDALNRLNYTSGPYGTITYAYDSVGNRIQMVNGSTITDYSYSPFNRLTSAGNVNYTYDANGNMITKPGGWTYSYDYENRLSSVSHNGIKVQSNYYDGDGNRVMQVAGNSSVVYSYQGVNILYQKNLTSDTVTKSFYAGGIQVAQMVNYTTYYLHQDALGSTRLVMPASMVSSFSSDYVPYGMSHALAGEEMFQYTGKLLDEATGLYYEGARYYDPTTGRFITQDSVVGSTSDPQSLNRYVYARDNPMKVVDMNGHEWWNPVADLTTAASDVVGAATDVANAASNAWNSLPPTDQTAIIIGVAVVAAVVTVGVAAPIVGAAVGAEVAADAGVDFGVSIAEAEAAATAAPEVTAAATTGGELVAETGSESATFLSSTAGKIAVQAGEGAVTNTAATFTTDVLQGKTPTLNQLATSALIGAGTGTLAGGLQSPTIGLTGSFRNLAISYVGAGVVGALLNTAASRQGPQATATESALNTGGGLVSAELEETGRSSIPPFIHYGLDILRGFL